VQALDDAHRAAPEVVVLGAGAIGCRIAAHLFEAGVACTLVDGWQAHVDAVQRQGLAFERAGSLRHLPLRAFGVGAPPDQTFDIVLFAPRSDQTLSLLPLAKSLLKLDGVIVSCQNGLNEEEIAQALGVHRTIGCSLILGARLAAPGHVQAIEGPDQLRVGGLDGVDPARVDAVARLLGPCGTVTRTDNLLGYRWMKLVLNATGNPLLLLSGLTARELHADARWRRAIIGLTREIVQTAQRGGARPEPVLELAAEHWLQPGHEPALHAALEAHGHMLGERRLSMVADFNARGRTEVDSITGKVVAKARAAGVHLPLNEAVLRLVHRMEAGQGPTPHEVLDELLALA
jgi:2-dehydropantoate 2-reductase